MRVVDVSRTRSENQVQINRNYILRDIFCREAPEKSLTFYLHTKRKDLPLLMASKKNVVPTKRFVRETKLSIRQIFLLPAT